MDYKKRTGKRKHPYRFYHDYPHTKQLFLNGSVIRNEYDEYWAYQTKIKNWLYENIDKNRNTWLFKDYSIFGKIGTCDWGFEVRFKNHKDATLFKMIWG